MTFVACWLGVTADHLYENCPARVRSLPSLRQMGWDGPASLPVDPDGTDICGTCHRTWKARQRREQ